MSETLGASEILDAIPLGVTIINKTLGIMYFNINLETLTFFNKDEANGINFDYILRSNISQKLIESLPALNPGVINSFEGDIINKNRKKIPVRIHISGLFDNEGALSSYLLTIQDISILKELNQKVKGAISFDTILGQSPKMRELFDILPVIANSDSSVLITGETGTGKDLLAEEIHKASKRAEMPFIKVNCGAIPASLLESELFGHVKGAYTGAISEHPGFFRMAHKGTIYLTEIGDLPLALQVKLLTVLDDKAFYPLGSSKRVVVDVRIIAGTHRNLSQLVAQKRFREDLYFRLNVVKLHLPPLRERGDDVPLLIDYFMSLFAKKLNKNINGFDLDARQNLMKYPYPGNVRELRNIIEYAVTVCRGDIINLQSLPQYVLDSLKNTPEEEKEPLTQVKDIDASKIVKDEKRERKQDIGGWETWREAEKKMILDALIQTKGNRSEAAKLMGWARSTLWRKIKEYGI